jgi:division protein CdvB (Snf7/Vps24/ESCRT-III family)
MVKGFRKKDAMKAIMEALALVRKAQLEVRRAKSRARTMSKLLSIQEYKDLMEALETLDIILERVALRLQTILVTGVFNKELLETPKEILVRALNISSMIPPSITQSLAEITDTLDVLASHAPSIPEASIPAVEESNSHVSENVEEVLREAKEEARRRLERLTE